MSRATRPTSIRVVGRSIGCSHVGDESSRSSKTSRPPDHLSASDAEQEKPGVAMTPDPGTQHASRRRVFIDDGLLLAP